MAGGRAGLVTGGIRRDDPTERIGGPITSGPNMELAPLFLSRVQFVWVVSFHILLPAFTMGLATFIAVLEGLHFFKRDPVYLRLSQYWLRIFGVSFGLGVVSGIVMPFQFGTNWSRYSDATANITGPLLAYEGLTAFFLEAGFLGVLLFGRKLVPPWAHFGAAILVAVGTFSSSFWILAVNSWMQTPQGHELIDGRFFPKDWFAIIFSPSFPYRLAHTVNAFFITTGLVVVAVGAYHLRNGRFVEESRRMMSMTLWLLTVLVPMQIFIGDAHGLNTLEPARSCREYFFVTYSGKAYSVDPGEKCNRYKRILASSVPKLPQLRPVIVRWSTLFRPRFAA